MGKRIVEIPIDLDSLDKELQGILMALIRQGTASQFFSGLLKLYNEGYEFDKTKSTSQTIPKKQEIKPTQNDNLMLNLLLDLKESVEEIKEFSSKNTNVDLSGIETIISKLQPTGDIQVGLNNSTVADIKRDISFKEDNIVELKPIDIQRSSKGKPNFDKLKKLKSGG